MGVFLHVNLPSFEDRGGFLALNAAKCKGKPTVWRGDSKGKGWLLYNLLKNSHFIICSAGISFWLL
ncbi:MAG: hypothetical protein EB060_09185 [Proteobacteria bacterium]|nr:hypothetical protein [Pseudomonadota bacterium]